MMRPPRSLPRRAVPGCSEWSSSARASLPGRVRGEDRGEVAVGEPVERGGVAERPVDPLDTVQAGELDGFGHLHLDPSTCPAAAASTSHIRAPSPSARNSASAALRRLGLAGQRPRPGGAGSGRRRSAGCPASTAGGGRPRPRPCAATWVATISSPSTRTHTVSIGQGVRDRVGDPTEADRRRPRHLAGLTERRRERRVGQPVQPWPVPRRASRPVPGG